MYIKSDRNFHVRDDLKIDTIENVWIETQDLVIGVIYKPPNFSNRDFLDKLDENLHTIYLSKKKCLIMGDDNINALKQSNISKEYLNLLRSEGFSPLIFEATRVTECNQTCIDHIYTNLSLPSTSGSIALEIADHLPVFSILYSLDQTPFPDKFEFRDFRRFDSVLFKTALSKVDWSPVFATDDVNECLSRFLHIFNRISNQHAPLKSTKVKNRTSKTWITQALKKSMNWYVTNCTKNG